MKQPLVSIIILNWNGKKWLKKCLNSLCSQTYKNYEIILVDNASTDDSIKLVKKNYPRVKVIECSQNFGFAKGNNIGIDTSEGDLIMLINNDIWVENNFLEKMILDFYTNKCDIIGPIARDYFTGGGSTYNIHIDILGHPVYLFNDKERKENFYLGGICLLFKKSFYKDTGGLDNDFFMYCEEIDWFWRLHLLKKKILQLDDLSIYHVKSGSTGKGIKYNRFLWRNQNTFQMLLKNYAWYNLLWVVPIYFLQNIFEILFFSLILKPKISLSYIQGWWFNIKNIKRILTKRRWIQKNRLISDFEIMKKMYIGSGKLKHLMNYIKNK